MVNVFQRIALGRCDLSAVDADSNELIALVRLEIKGFALACTDADRAARRDGAAFGCFRLNGVAALCRGWSKAHFDRMIDTDRLILILN